MAEFEAVLALAYAFASALVGAGVAAGIGYYKKTAKEEWSWYKFGRTLFVAAIMVPVAAWFGLPLTTPTEIVEAQAAALFGYGLYVYAVEAIFVLLWRKALVPLATRVREWLAKWGVGT